MKYYILSIVVFVFVMSVVAVAGNAKQVAKASVVISI